MAPTPSKSNQMGPSTPSSRSNQNHQSKTPQSKHRLNFHMPKPSPNPNSAIKDTTPAEHPVEVIGRIRDYPDRKEKPISALQINQDRQSLRVRTDIGYRDFGLDGVSLSEEEDLDGFYKKFVESRINGVKMGDKCTIMMYGPTGSGKSHTMFGCAKQPGIVYKSLRDILGEGNEESDDQTLGVRAFVQVTVLEIYNEEIYDLLSTNNAGGLSLGWSKASASKVRLEVMGKKAKNATFISGNEAGKISKEIQKVEKRRIVKSTLCNERSSRSHCMIILDVPTVGGRLMLVDMAGSENIEQAGQSGLEAKMQTGKINQGNIALKRVVESIANNDSHVPFRDSKLTMLLQDSFEDDKSKILMILCASPDPREIHKTISTLEYGAKAKCIVRGPHTPTKEKIGGEDSSSTVILGSRIAAMDQFIFKLQMENKLKEKERNDAHKELVRKEEEIAALRAKLEQVEVKGSGTSEEEISLMVNELLKQELEKKIQECQKMANEFVELERKKMEEKILQQQQEVEMLRQRLEEIESELYRSSNENGKGNNGSSDMDGGSFARRLLEMYAEEDPGMEKSMDLDKSMDMEISKQDVKFTGCAARKSDNNTNLAIWNEKEVHDVVASTFPDKVCLSTVYEDGEELDDEEDKENSGDEEVQKEVIEEKTVCSSSVVEGSHSGFNFKTSSFAPSFQTSIPATPIPSSQTVFRDRSEEKHAAPGLRAEPENAKDAASSRRMRIQNIFTLCGNYRELSQHNITPPIPCKKRFDVFGPLSSPVKTIDEDSDVKISSNENSLLALTSEKFEKNQKFTEPLKTKFEDTDDEISVESKQNYNPSNESTGLKTKFEDTDDEISVESKENYNPSNESTGYQLEVYVKWEAAAASKEKSGKFITTLKVTKNSTLADLRKQIEVHLGQEKQAFTFLALGDPTGAPVPREKESTVQASKLPMCNNQLQGHLACLRPVKSAQYLPLSPLENKLPITPNAHFVKHGDDFSPKIAQHLSSTPFITVRRY